MGTGTGNDRNRQDGRDLHDQQETQEMQEMEEMEDTILELLSHRRAGATNCPSEAARVVAGPGGDWRPLMDQARAAAAHLVEAGEVVITQRGEVVDLGTARGPIRIRRA